jgi:hypothetical protein
MEVAVRVQPVDIQAEEADMRAAEAADIQAVAVTAADTE